MSYRQPNENTHIPKKYNLALGFFQDPEGPIDEPLRVGYAQVASVLYDYRLCIVSPLAVESHPTQPDGNTDAHNANPAPSDDGGGIFLGFYRGLLDI